MPYNAFEATGFGQDLLRNEIKGRLWDHVFQYTNTLKRRCHLREKHLHHRTKPIGASFLVNGVKQNDTGFLPYIFLYSFFRPITNEYSVSAQSVYELLKKSWDVNLLLVTVIPRLCDLNHASTHYLANICPMYGLYPLWNAEPYSAAVTYAVFEFMYDIQLSSGRITLWCNSCPLSVCHMISARLRILFFWYSGPIYMYYRMWARTEWDMDTGCFSYQHNDSYLPRLSSCSTKSIHIVHSYSPSIPLSPNKPFNN